ncbi:MAG: M23 family metallopeptidase [Bacteroidota bacterium]|nr:M23 family metallopeptidase [Bacteroidota bacterium]
MPKNEKKKSNWRDKYRFSVTNDTTFEEIWRIKLTQYNAFLLITCLVLFFIGATVSLIAFTNLREFIPGYPDVTMRRNILLSAIRLDSLERELALRDKYFSNLSAIISGNQPVEAFSLQDTTKKYQAITFKTFPEDSALRSQVEKDDRFNLSPGTLSPEAVTSPAALHFFPPVKGIVSGKYDPRARHYGTDIVTKPDSPVSAALDGTVIFTGWTMETGFVIEIQHSNNIVSVYKHNERLLKDTGDMVKTGEVIAIVGNSGELYTSGPHLHFEIWYKGSPLDPEKYIIF